MKIWKKSYFQPGVLSNKIQKFTSYVHFLRMLPENVFLSKKEAKPEKTWDLGNRAPARRDGERMPQVMARYQAQTEARGRGGVGEVSRGKTKNRGLPSHRPVGVLGNLAVQRKLIK